MPEIKTRPTTASITGFIKRQPDEQTRADCLTLVALMEQVPGEEAVMWGPSIIGFGTYQLVYADGSEADWPIALSLNCPRTVPALRLLSFTPVA